MDFTDFTTLVIGGGISGITAAVELAEAGKHVLLLEKEPYLGGNVSGSITTSQSFVPPSCGLGNQLSQNSIQFPDHLLYRG